MKKRKQKIDWEPTDLDKRINSIISDFEEKVSITHFDDVYHLAAAEKERNREIVKAVLENYLGGTVQV